jgi:hypothetical protein
MIGDALFCNLKFNHVVIVVSNESINTLSEMIRGYISK